MRVKKAPRVTVATLIQFLDKNPMLENATEEELNRVRDLAQALVNDVDLELERKKESLP